MTALLTTDRTLLRLPTTDDDEFFLTLLNDPELVRTTGDRGIRDLEDARGYITDKLLASQTQHGFTLYVVELREDNTPVGINGLVQRPYLDAPDLGFAFLPDYRRHGYGLETSRAVLHHTRRTLRIDRLLGITNSANPASCQLLERLGFHHQRTTTLPGSAEKLHRIYQLGPG